MRYDAEFIGQLFIGNLTYALLTLSMMMTRLLTLRLLAIAGGISGGSYSWFWFHDPVGVTWEAIFTLVNVVQICLMFYRNRASDFSEEERDFHASILPLLDPHQVRRVLRAGTWRVADRSTALIRQGVQVSDLIFIRSGEADVLVDGRLVGLCGPGSLIGEIGISTEKPATATIVVREPVRYFAVGRTALQKAMKSDSAIARAIDRSIYRSLEGKLIRMNLVAAGKT